MSASESKVLMITPFHSQQRGNSLTSARLKNGLQNCGFNIDLLSLEENQAEFFFKNRLKNQKYALLHAFHGRYTGRLLAEYPALNDLPFILTTTGTDINYDIHGSEKNYVELAWQAADRIVVFNRDFVEVIRQSHPELLPKLITIPQGIYLPAGNYWNRRQLGYNNDDFIFFLPSGLRPVKNIDLALDALEPVYREYPHLRLLIIGADINPDYSQIIRTRISNLPWAKYLGEIAHNQTRGLIEMVDAVINTSQAEGQPQAVLEAMSLGKPCIMTAVPGNLNIIQSGQEGFYANDATEFSQAAKIFISNPEVLKKMGLAARRLVETNYRLEEELAAYAALYRQLMV
ncbi:Glycosyl transferase, family 1 [Syntrophomonas zehnderi OL-4]|uniref:Glycosyl transferase, family 1 n=1 Tax=Syntrophomonas zehnderi OL-4 TaxID=690567 RepID=A0A0E4C9S7_9FIRM|nr:glycosyltransferase [Syntrophomonas zehnderi]CFY11443.1 Glycosyl transferase, family 1 [Syntrophomonas zehnderi OL-4]